MYRICKYVTDKTLLTIYNSLIYPYILYGIPIWGNADNVHLKPIYTIQKKAVRIISNKDYYVENTYLREHSTPLFNNLRLLKIYDVFKVEALKFVFDSLNKTNPNQFHEYFSFHTFRNVNTASIRNKYLIRPFPRTSTYGIKSLKYTGVILWNNLSLTLRDMPSKLSFSKTLKKNILTSYE